MASTEILPVLRTGNRDNELFQINRNLQIIKESLEAFDSFVEEQQQGEPGSSDGIIEVSGDVLLKPGTGNSYVNEDLILTAAHPDKSVEFDGTTLELVGDEDAPGASHYYGTNTTGTKGFHDLNSFSVGLVSLAPQWTGQSVTSTSYVDITSSNFNVSNASCGVLYNLLLNFPTNGTSGTILIQPASAFIAPTRMMIGVVGLSSGMTAAMNAAATEATITINTTFGANSKRMIQVMLFGDTSSLTAYKLQIRKGTVSNNFTVDAVTFLGNYN